MSNIEITVNAAIADELRQHNVRWRDADRLTAEQTGTLDGPGRPDIVVHNEYGAPVIIETEFVPAQGVEHDAIHRLGAKHTRSATVVESCIAVRIPHELRAVPQVALRDVVRDATFEYCLFTTKMDNQPNRWPHAGFISGSIGDLARLLENTSVSQRLVDESLTVLETGVEMATNVLRDCVASRPDVGEKIHDLLHQQQVEPGIHQQTARMAMVIVANALTYHSIIANAHGIAGLNELRHSTPPTIMSQTKVMNEWQRILTEINYWPIFNIARQIIAFLPSRPGSMILETLTETANKLAEQGITRSHDLAGRMFQRLICDRKYLATFYTLPSSSALLAELAVQMLVGDTAAKSQMENLRIADLACGTGTLLAAAYQSLLRRYRRGGGNDVELHAKMMEQTLIAADIMPAATHLTTSMLSSIHPAQVFNDTCVYTLPYGDAGDGVHIGSLDLIADEYGVDLFGTQVRTTTGRGGDHQLSAHEVLENFALIHSSLDMVIINPPFTRPTNHEIADAPVPSFAGFSNSDAEQALMATKLGQIRTRLEEPAGHGNAGLASNFIDLAHIKLKPGGILAMVAPLTLVQGNAWRNSRNLLTKQYEDLHFITIAASRANDKSFSADTGMGEALVLARKTKTHSHSKKTAVHFVNLHSRPATVVEAAEVAHAITKSVGQARVTSVPIGASTVGVIIQESSIQGALASVRDPDIVKAAIALGAGEVQLPRHDPITAPLVPLEAVGVRGPLHRDINGKTPRGEPRGPFDIEPITAAPTYPALWNHHHSREQSIAVPPDCQCILRSGMEDHASAVWNTASRLHYTLEFGTNSQCLTACYTTSKCIGGRAWPSFILHDDRFEKLAALWANSTLGMISFWSLGTKQHPGRACLTLSRLPDVITVDAGKLTISQVNQANTLFADVADQHLLPAHHAYRDPVRQAIDKRLLIDVLAMPTSVMDSVAVLRDKWCAEPTVHGGRANRIEEPAAR